MSDSLHMPGVGTGEPSVEGWIPAGRVTQWQEGGNVIKLEGLQDNMANSFRSGDFIRLDTVGCLFSGKQMSFIVLNDAASNNNGNCWITVQPEIRASLEDPYRNIHKPIPIGEPVFLAEAHKVTLKIPQWIMDNANI